MYQLIAVLLIILFPVTVHASIQRYEHLIISTQIFTQTEINDEAVTYQEYAKLATDVTWLATMSERLKRFKSNQYERESFLRTVYYEATRAGLNPQLVLSVIQVESGFRKYAISHAGARGYMQIMPFWVDTIGDENHNLFHLRVNLRYGCMILRHYLNKENGDLFRALGRYNGSLGQSAYPQLVFNLWHNTWHYFGDTL
ncbi:MAG TPA: lytic transglycosylase domain-containing protein [Nitrosomonas sp.]|uniref:lytic transglycosylase domain-containing protein n=1 Tax=Nitrosomonas sp. TaxID=42353 RepID=UPI000E857D93|nr:lytic transglycosylase domain-containing protein [Nitrosomonas sp.]GJL74881.1 MAG: transglycosylase [Nitrosomonas sp.]HBV20314.1 transglycosylase [Nitrosomonas sp.]HNP25159.1 lytic transglycosylase domain-containing protein [Nitrosomonas sp.]